MGIRETLNENPKLVTRATVFIIAVAVIFAFWHVLPAGRQGNIPHEFFSDDDGATWFIDSSARLAPFDHDGRQAVLAKVFRCRSGTEFVGYLEKFTDDAKKQIVADRTTGHMKPGIAAMEQGISAGDILIKKPHGGKWVSSRSPQAIEVETIECPDGGSDFQPVLP
jgi:hypothetical protein